MRHTGYCNILPLKTSFSLDSEKLSYILMLKYPLNYKLQSLTKGIYMYFYISLFAKCVIIGSKIKNSQQYEATKLLTSSNFACFQFVDMASCVTS